MGVWPVLASLGPFTFYTYTVLIDLGIAAGFASLYLAAARQGEAAARSPARWVDAGIAATLGGLAGARLGYVFSNWAYYGSHLGEALRIWEGGLAWPGAAAGGALALWLFCRWRGEPFWAAAGALTLPVLLLSALAWLGCAANACAPGREVAPGELPGWFAVDWPDEFGVRALRWPTQVLGFLWSLVLIAIYFWARDKGVAVASRAGLLLALAGIAVGAVALAFTRGDAMPQVAGMRIDALASGIVLTVALALLVVRGGEVKRKT